MKKLNNTLNFLWKTGLLIGLVVISVFLYELNENLSGVNTSGKEITAFVEDQESFLSEISNKVISAIDSSEQKHVPEIINEFHLIGEGLVNLEQAILVSNTNMSHHFDDAMVVINKVPASVDSLNKTALEISDRAENLGEDVKKTAVEMANDFKPKSRYPKIMEWLYPR